MQRVKRGLAVIAAAAYFFLPTFLENSMNVVERHDPYAVSDEAQPLHDSLVIGGNINRLLRDQLSAE
jgi:hypothetical protein